MAVSGDERSLAEGMLMGPTRSPPHLRRKLDCCIQLLQSRDRCADVREISLDRRLHGRLPGVLGKRTQHVEPALGYPR